jgi:hypothetical protein
MMKTTHLLFLALTALGGIPLFIIILGGHRPPLINPQRSDDPQCTTYYGHFFFFSQHHQRVVWGCVATCSFALATSLRTTIMAPLTRLYEKHESLLRPLNCTLETMKFIADSMEEFSHKVWEDISRDADVWNDDVVNSSYSQPPEIDLNVSVPCDYESRKKHLLGGRLHEEEPPNHHKWCKLRDVITRDVLIEYASAYDTKFDLATHPIILRNVWPQKSFQDGSRRLTPTGLLNDPVYSNILLPNYFHDAAETGYNALVPDSKQITLSQFLRNIQSGEAPRSKIGTQVIIERHPELRGEIINASLAKELFLWREDPIKEKSRWLSWLPSTSYYPIFIADNKPTSEQSPRTDLHAEPIGNIAVQLHGTRRWTLVATKWSKLLKPTVSKHGRAYYFSNMDPQHELPKRLKSLPLVYECVTNRGDALWVPPWMWHRIDYSSTPTQKVAPPNFDEDDTLSLGASIFHFFPKLFARAPLFAFLILPNLIWEVLGINIE